MPNITVHVLNFHGIFSHIELVLETEVNGKSVFYGINRWEEPADKWSEQPKNYIDEADSVYSFDIDADPDDIIQKWTAYHDETKDEASILGENCAVAAQKFLTHFANIPEPSSSNTSWNHLALGIMWPSFLPSLVTLPGRIMDNAKFHTKKEHFSSWQTLPNDHSNPYIKQALTKVKKDPSIKNNSQRQKLVIAKLNSLVQFYDNLADVSQHAEKLKERGHDEAHETAKKLIANLSKSASEYLCNHEENSYIVFKKKCDFDINKAKPILEKHRGWKKILGNIALTILGVGLFYFLAACVNKAMTGKFLFFETSSMEKVNAVNKAVSLAGEKDIAMHSKPLTPSRPPKKK